MKYRKLKAASLAVAAVLLLGSLPLQAVAVDAGSGLELMAVPDEEDRKAIAEEGQRAGIVEEVSLVKRRLTIAGTSWYLPSHAEVVLLDERGRQEKASMRKIKAGILVRFESASGDKIDSITEFRPVRVNQ